MSGPNPLLSELPNTWVNKCGRGEDSRAIQGNKSYGTVLKKSCGRVWNKSCGRISLQILRKRLKQIPAATSGGGGGAKDARWLGGSRPWPSRHAQALVSLHYWQLQHTDHRPSNYCIYSPMQVMHYCIASYAFVVLNNIVMNTAIAIFCNFCVGKHCYAIQCK